MVVWLWEGGFKKVLRNAIAKEETACLDSSADKGSTDAAVEASNSFRAEGFSETVDGACIMVGRSIRLRLKADFYRIEWVFDNFAGDASDLFTESL